MGPVAVAVVMGGGGIGQQLQKQVGQTGIPAYNVANACATGATALRTVIMAVKAGEVDYGLAVGVEKLAMPARRDQETFEAQRAQATLPLGDVGGFERIERAQAPVRGRCPCHDCGVLVEPLQWDRVNHNVLAR